MNRKFLSLLSGVSALALAGAAQAAEPAHTGAPMELSVAQLDSVTAGRPRGRLNLNLANIVQINNSVQIGVVIGSGEVANTAVLGNIVNFGQQMQLK